MPPSAPKPAPRASSAAVAAVMRANRSSNTGPERRLRSALHQRGLRFRKDYCLSADGVRIRIDVAFPRHRLAVLVDGCFWHACPVHFALPRTNTTYWSAKMARNRARDAANGAGLASLGWRLVRVWEHTPADEAAQLVLTQLDATFATP